MCDMPCSSDFLLFLKERLEERGEISFKKLFGEVGVYLNGKIFGIASNNEFFLKEEGFGIKGEYFFTLRMAKKLL
jgi:TfoX/Sxy family transcriptional regulator of competence genes